MLTIPLLLRSQSDRRIDGSGNNPLHPQWGMAGASLANDLPNAFSDGISSPAGTDRPNPRDVSNLLFNQDIIMPGSLNLSDFVWLFGQFIDHDLSIVKDGHTESIMIPIPKGDAYFDPNGTGTAVIPMMRSAALPNSGTAIDNPRNYANAITAWIDGSMVYGSDEQRANWLRTFSQGKLKTSAGNLLPFNTVTGEYNHPVDPNAPVMDDPIGRGQRKVFVAGDVRCNENLNLISIHTLFVREHNRLCDEIALHQPTWTDEQIYQRARKTVGALIQAIVYEEWLPAIGIELSSFTGYDINKDPSILNVFSAAAFRLGHTLLSDEIMRVGNDGATIAQGNITLKDAFFAPTKIYDGGIDPLLKGMSIQKQQTLDCKVVNSVRNFLFGAPGQGGMDLVSINIARGRERGLPDYNTIRASYGLNRKESFEEIDPDPATAVMLEQLYGSVDNIDPWVGFLADRHMPNSIMGETVMYILKKQFEALRDGDRYYYEADVSFTPSETRTIKKTRLSDIIRRNTGITNIQDNVFEAMRSSVSLQLDASAAAGELGIMAYPNPFTSELNIMLLSKAASDQQGTCAVYDFMGRRVLSMNVAIAKGNSSIELGQAASSLPRGAYLVVVEMGDIRKVVKVLKG